MELSDQCFFDLRIKFLELFEDYNITINKFKLTCEHFIHATSLFLKIASIFLRPKSIIAALPLLCLIEQLLRSLNVIEEIKDHNPCFVFVKN